TDRLGGQTRFETSVSISQESFPDGADDVFLARADIFPDALSAGSLTTGPILLVEQCGDIPQVVLDEVERLEPGRVVALGGEDAVCGQVLEDAAEAAAGPSEEPTPTESPTEECTELPVVGECPDPSESPTPTENPAA
ncbi:MAG TPA: cell wall-binding repeat-containing protein, partial [Euzebya sp.]|nr:cell wall-binding repeat-containing protein [Euzebya sp.]